MAQQKGNGAGVQEFASGNIVAKSSVKAIKIDAGFDLITEDDASNEAVERILQLVQPLLYQVTVADGTEVLVDAQTEVNYDGVDPNGSFTSGATHNTGDVITLSDNTTVTVDTLAASRVTVNAQDETFYDGAGDNGSFVGGDGVGGTAHVGADVLTMSDGSTITVVAVDGNGDVTQFTVNSSTAAAGTVSGVALTQTGLGGTGDSFTYTPGVNNIGGEVLEFTIANAGSTVGTVSGTTLTFNSSTGPGVAFTLTPNDNNVGGGGGIIYAVVDSSQFSAASLQLQIRAIGTDTVNGKVFTSATVTEGTGIVVS